MQVSFKSLPLETNPTGQPSSILMSVTVWMYPAGSTDEKRRIKARVLLDSASDISLIRREDAKLLRLPPRGKPNSVPLQISCSTGKVTPKTMETAHAIDLHALDHSGSLKDVRVLTVKEIGVPLAPLNFKQTDFEHLKPFTFGEDLPSTAPRVINVMLSAAYTMEILNSAPTKGHPNHPAVWQSVLGPALAGRSQ